jgi:hypothetical protein
MQQRAKWELGWQPSRFELAAVHAQQRTCATVSYKHQLKMGHAFRSYLAWESLRSRKRQCRSK